MDEFLAKPVQLAELDAMLSACLDGRQREASQANASPFGSSDARLHMLTDTFGSAEQTRNMLRGLLATTRQDIAALHLAIQAGDSELQRLILHRIHGALRFLGVDTFDRGGHSVQQRDRLVRYLNELEAWLEQIEMRSEDAGLRAPR